jgi:hypothetical protein
MDRFHIPPVMTTEVLQVEEGGESKLASQFVAQTTRNLFGTVKNRLPIISRKRGVGGGG